MISRIIELAREMKGCAVDAMDQLSPSEKAMFCFCFLLCLGGAPQA